MSLKQKITIKGLTSKPETVLDIICLTALMASKNISTSCGIYGLKKHKEFFKIDCNNCPAKEHCLTQNIA